MGVQRILPIKVSITIDTMLNFKSDFDGRNDGNVTFRQKNKLFPTQQNIQKPRKFMLNLDSLNPPRNFLTKSKIVIISLVA